VVTVSLFVENDTTSTVVENRRSNSIKDIRI